MGWIDGVSRASGLDERERNEIEALLDVFRRMRRRNELIDSYYEADVRPKPIGPDTMISQVQLDVDITCHWPKKAVHSLSSLVKFDDFVFDGERDESLDLVLRNCGFASALSRHRVGMLKNGCCFATVGKGADGHAYVRFHSANTATAIMDATTEMMRSGLVIAATSVTEWSKRVAVPVQVNLHMPGEVVVIRRGTTNAERNSWHATRMPLGGDTCLMVPIAYRPTENKPLGSSRIDSTIRDLVDDVLHLRQVLVLSTELYAIPMRYIVGLNSSTFEELKKNPKWALYLNPVFTATRDSRSGNTAELGQLPANSPAALLDLIYTDAKMFASATGVPLNSLGIVQDNPSSAEAIAEGRKDMTDEAQDLIDNQMKPALRQVAILAMMVEHNVESVDGLDESQRSVLARFKNPAMPSISASTDAAMKIASVNPGFAQTSVFYEMVGFDRETIRRIEKEQRMNQSRQSFGSLLANTARDAQSQGTIGERPNGFGMSGNAPREETASNETIGS
jgi:hypothetical protein